MLCSFVVMYVGGGDGYGVCAWRRGRWGFGRGRR